MRLQRVLFLILISTTLVLAAPSNTGGDKPLPTDPHVLSGRATGFNILYAPSQSDDAAYRAAIAAITGGTVDYFNASAGTPDLGLLSTYDVVYTWADMSYADNVAFGNNLAAYVDQGGVVILGAFCTYTSGNYLSGTIMSPGYCPVVSPTGSNHFTSSDYAGDGTTCIHDAVTAYECQYRDILALQGDGAQDGSYLDGEIAHAYRPDFHVIYSNGSGHTALGCSGQWAQLVANAGSCGLDFQAIPTLHTWGLAAFGGLLLLAGLIFMRRRA